jgi:hypothetical protein
MWQVTLKAIGCSEFCLFEFNAALHRCLELGKKRLIVLMMLDEPQVLLQAANDDNSRSALRQYLRQYTYIDYRAADWLDRLSYALPINGMLENDGKGRYSEEIEQGFVLFDGTKITELTPLLKQ